MLKYLALLFLIPVVARAGTIETISNITVDGTVYEVHTFTGAGSTTLMAPNPAVPMDVLLVAGGGGGAAGGGGGGGGAIQTTYTAGAGEQVPVAVGAGGSTQGGQGGNSVFGSLVAVGGGAGNDWNNDVGASVNGGSGGGHGGWHAAGTGVPGQGYSGGACTQCWTDGGGGGGASAPGGGTWAWHECGSGGDGVSSSISGTPTYYGGGGGGSALHFGCSGGLGGGGSVVGDNGQPGTPSTGGGGAGASYGSSGAGGSGIVIVRFVKSGACCFGDGTCSYVVQAQCTGTWLGTLTTCNPNPCDLGACCSPTACVILAESSCPAAFAGYLTICQPNPCLSAVDEQSGKPLDTRVWAAPNPGTGQILIQYELPAPAAVSLKVFDASGSLVRQLSETSRSAGQHTVVWDGRDAAGRKAPAGIYLLRMESAGGDATGRLVKTQ